MRKVRPHADSDADCGEDFRAAVRDVTPIARSGRIERSPVRPAPVPVQRLEDDRQVLKDSLTDQLGAEAALESGAALTYLRDGLSPQILRKLRSGHWAVQDELDLHGLRAEQARTLLTEFLDSAYRRGQRCVRVIHGRGLGSPGREPVIKRKVAAWLAGHRDVLAYCEARPADGGPGAAMVLLRGRGASRVARERARE
jgi:DNA-nicking Smr family endonuclease